MTYARLMIATALATSFAAFAHAESLTVALSSAPSSIDPHFATTGQNQQLAMVMFDRLVHIDQDGQFTEGLATDWEVSEDRLTWTFTLREGVTFHNGEDFTAEDVVFTIERIPEVPNSPAPFTQRLAAIESVEAVDERTVEITTNAPAPNLLTDLSTIYIVSRSIGEDAPSAAFDAGDAAFGTGPYRLASYTPGDRLVIERNDDYWGDPVDFEAITIRFIDNSAARVASLQAGEVDFIDAVPPNDLERLAAMDGIEVVSEPSARLIYMGLDQGGETTPQVRALDGSEMENPFLDRNVREALSLAINREALIDRIQFGSGAPAGQFAPEGIFGHNPDIEPPAYDIDRARDLLQEAGYGDGFQLTVHGPSDRYVNDADVTLAVGQMWSQLGLDIEVETLPFNVYSPAATAREFSAFLFSFGITTGESSLGYRNVLATYDEDRGWGSNNRFRYSNEEFDTALSAAFEAFDDAEREGHLQEAARIAADDVAVIPLYWEGNNWAVRDGLAFSQSPDGRSLMTNLSAN
jgi:peptide/nickel transport system substrate-binding protein